ncbi:MULTISPECIES: hypothetical protein [Halomonadaceae]|uniref:Lipid/polyisoprenoid-binding YceI-like domain-containing protein n=1 Tax=Vreelandella janggokensis TaxID=370767 RepID=A0ABT4IWD4_9GAMM|nr:MULTISPECIES: hypothetical protein [Halomonas]MCZ0927970.1 hypothetical protein [Halomonas janggokensis]MCZ0930572.1 hypothetical protein [Halomonas janggokensis]MDR5884628.1 hypothetical protein [Halomonas janggokensis]QPL45340.1 hypothetical protein IT895_14275 [Halomonas sp. A40-4]
MKALMALFSLLLAVPAHADWQLDPDRSNVQASITQLNGDEPQTHHHQVRDLQGDISEDGTLRLPLKLSQTDMLTRFGELPTWAEMLANTTLVTLVAQMPPERLDALDIGESLVETLTFRLQSDMVNQEEAVPLRFTREGLNEVRVTHAEPMVLDGRALMANATLRSVLSLLGYQEIDEHVPVTLDARLVNR